jgi:hypothetical protein
MSDEKDVPILSIENSDPLHDQIIAVVEFIRVTTFKGIIEPSENQLGARSMLMTAAEMFAGMIFGELMVAGFVSGKDRKRALEMARKNFNEGIKVVEARAKRIAAEMAAQPGVTIQ